MRAELFHAVPDVKQSRHARAYRRAKRPDLEPARIQIAVPVQQNPEDHDHLQHRRDFAHEARTHDHLADGEPDDGDADEQQQIASDDGAGEPERNLPEIRPVVEAQRDDARHEQQFVRERIENRAQLAFLVVTPRDVTVHAVQNRRDRKRKKGQQPVNFVAGFEVINQFDDKKRDQQDSQNRDFVGGRHGR